MSAPHPSAELARRLRMLKRATQDLWRAKQALRPFDDQSVVDLAWLVWKHAHEHGACGSNVDDTCRSPHWVDVPGRGRVRTGCTKDICRLTRQARRMIGCGATPWLVTHKCGARKAPTMR